VILAGINLKFFYWTPIAQGWLSPANKKGGARQDSERLRRERTLATEAQDGLPPLTPFGTRYILAW
jgi:hypothetical protein